MKTALLALALFALAATPHDTHARPPADAPTLATLAPDKPDVTLVPAPAPLLAVFKLDTAPAPAFRADVPGIRDDASALFPLPDRHKPGSLEHRPAHLIFPAMLYHGGEPLPDRARQSGVTFAHLLDFRHGSRGTAADHYGG